MAERKTERRVRKVSGVVLPEARYDANGVMEAAGIGEHQLSEARKSGIVKPIHLPTRTWYRGSEIIAWIDSHAGK